MKLKGDPNSDSKLTTPCGLKKGGWIELQQVVFGTAFLDMGNESNLDSGHFMLK